jgi:hypothetical protein
MQRSEVQTTIIGHCCPVPKIDNFLLGSTHWLPSWTAAAQVAACQGFLLARNMGVLLARQVDTCQGVLFGRPVATCQGFHLASYVATCLLWRTP